jgi:hypothetical protein
MLDKLMPWRQPKDDETSDVIAKVFHQWKQTHSEGTLRDFSQAVAAGEVQLPTK